MWFPGQLDPHLAGEFGPSVRTGGATVAIAHVLIQLSSDGHDGQADLFSNEIVSMCVLVLNRSEALKRV